MPKQSRGFWTCTLCGLTFDRFQDAEYHEIEECSQRPPPPRYPPPGAMPPYETDPRTDSMPSASHYHSQMDYGPRKSRRVSLLGPQERANLSELDAVALQQVELFEAGDMYAADSSGNRTSPGQIGVRCLHCLNGPAADSFMFPADLVLVGDLVRGLVRNHVCRCDLAPGDLKGFLKRTVEREPPHERDRNRKILTDFCARRCHQFGILNRFPGNTGIHFREAESSQQYPQMGGSERYANETGPSYGISYPLHPNQMSSNRNRSPILIEGQPPSMSPHHASPPTHESPMPMPRNSRPSPYSGRNPEGFGPSGFRPNYDVPANFPFAEEPNGEWVCKYCSHIPPEYRDPHYRWAANKGPPPGTLIDHHFSLCRAYQQSLHPIPSYGYGSKPEFPSPYPGSSPPPAVFDTTQRRSSINSYQHSASASMGGFQQFDPRDTTVEAHPGPGPVQASSMLQTELDHHEASRRTQAADYLARKDKSIYSPDGDPLPENKRLVLDEDKLLLTTYFFYLMKQLRLVRFSEADRKTRGGKRENIQVGYGGLQCVHCVEMPNSRKFFWSNVDRLANSFAEIPGHILKCRQCPQPVKDALNDLKALHASEMTQLPRGSQKVFFRRMWRRLHEQDDRNEVREATPSTPPSDAEANKPRADEETLSLEKKDSATDGSPAVTVGSGESIFLPERSTDDAAKALAEWTIQAGPPSPSSRVLLAIPEDKEWLSDTDCFIRRQIEVFCATYEDVQIALEDRKYPIQEGQVGIRCIHCAMAKDGANKEAVSYPFSISGIYESVREFQRLHLETCRNLPPGVQKKLSSLKGAASLSSVLRKYYVLAAKALGLKDTEKGVRAGGETVQVGAQAAFVFSESTPKASEDVGKDLDGEMAAQLSPETSRKRILNNEDTDREEPKKAVKLFSSERSS
jgi:hypothetical protein